MPMPNGCGRGSFQATASRHDKWRRFPAKSHGFCERGLPFAANGLAVSETKGRESLAGTMASIASHRLGHYLDDILDEARVRPAAVLAAGSFWLFAAVRIYRCHSGSICARPVHGASRCKT